MKRSRGGGHTDGEMSHRRVGGGDGVSQDSMRRPWGLETGGDRDQGRKS
jgi:hypothetical protein